MLVSGLLAYAVLLGSLPLVSHPFALGLWSLAMGLAAGFVGSLPTAFIGDRVGSPLHGVAVGWLRTMTDGGQILGPIVMGAVADAMHIPVTFLLASALLVTIAWRCHRHVVTPTASLEP